jgi:hypothetical protein
MDWYRHIAFSALAHAYLMVVRQHANGREATVRYAVKLLPFTIPEVSRLPSHMV